MTLFEGKNKYEIQREGEDIILWIDYEAYNHLPSIEDSEECMSIVLDLLVEVNEVTKIVFYQKRDYEYDYAQAKLLMEIARVYKKLLKQKDLFRLTSLSQQDQLFTSYYSQRYIELQNIIFRTLKEDPISAYVDVKHILKREELEVQNNQQAVHDNNYMLLLKYIISLLEQTKLIGIAKPFLTTYKQGDRSLYARIFSPTIKPDFVRGHAFQFKLKVPKLRNWEQREEIFPWKD